MIASSQPVTYTVIETPSPPIEKIAEPKPAPPPIQPPAPPKAPPKPVKPSPPVAKGTGKGQPKQEAKPTKQGDHRKVLEMMENSLSALETKSSSPLSPTRSTTIGPLKSETISYTERLVSLLKQMLVFPEPENVIVEIQISSSGRVLSCSVVESPSSTNRDYVLSVLPHLQLPSFDGELKGKAAHTFKVKLIADL